MKNEHLILLYYHPLTVQWGSTLLWDIPAVIFAIPEYKPPAKAPYVFCIRIYSHCFNSLSKINLIPLHNQNSKLLCPEVPYACMWACNFICPSSIPFKHSTICSRLVIMAYSARFANRYIVFAFLRFYYGYAHIGAIIAIDTSITIHCVPP